VYSRNKTSNASHQKKAQLKKKLKNANEIEKQLLEAELKLANGAKTMLDDKVKAGAKTSNTAKENIVKLKLILQEFVAKCGPHRISLAKAIELVYEVFGACK
jgi:hypothetical protein